MEELQALHRTIDSLDEELLYLFIERMQLCRDIAHYKAHHDLSVFDNEREHEKLSQLVSLLPPDLLHYGERLFETMKEISYYEQQRIIDKLNEGTTGPTKLYPQERNHL